MIDHVFVYGTLRPGDVRWHFLEPFVQDRGRADTATGTLFDTGFDYPAAVFDGTGTIHGQTIRLRTSTLDEALAELDRVEGVVDGDYGRVTVTTGSGITAWAYASSDGLALTAIPSGDWFAHRPVPTD